MKLILSMIRPEKLPDVKKALLKNEIGMLTLLDVRGCGQQKGFFEEYRGVVEEVDLHRKVMLLIGVNDSFVKSTVDAITKAARTGKIGDGKIFVLPIEDCFRIRTGEQGVIAIGGESEEANKVKK